MVTKPLVPISWLLSVTLVSAELSLTGFHPPKNPKSSFWTPQSVVNNQLQITTYRSPNPLEHCEVVLRLHDPQGLPWGGAPSLEVLRAGRMGLSCWGLALDGP